MIVGLYYFDLGLLESSETKFYKEVKKQQQKKYRLKQKLRIFTTANIT